jgi:hypothetical protein
MQGPLEKISAGSLQGSSHKDLYKIFAQGSLDKDLYKIFPQGSPLWRSCNDPLNGFLQDISTRIFVQRSLEHLRARISWRGALQDLPHKDLHQLFSQGPVQDHAKTSWKDFSCISVRYLGRSSVWDFQTTFHVKPAVPLSSKKAKGSTMGGTRVPNTKRK